MPGVTRRASHAARAFRSYDCLVPDYALDTRSVLRAVGELVRREVDLEELLARVIEAVTAAMEAERCTIYLVDRANGEVFSKADRKSVV